MASKFVIKKRNWEEVFKNGGFYWRLLDTNGYVVLTSKKSFETTKEAKQDIAKVKKAITRYTKVEVEE